MEALVCFALIAFFPREGDLPGLAELGVEAKIARLRRESTLLFWTGLVAAAIFFQLSPIATMRNAPGPRRCSRPSDLDTHAYRTRHATALYVVRQIIVLLKLMGGVFWGESPEIRAFLSLPPYGPDPGTRRIERRVARRAAPSARAVAARSSRSAAAKKSAARAAIARRSATGCRSTPRMHVSGEHLTFTAFGQPAIELEVDFVVVGSGAGGAAAAVVLARAGHRVAVVEAGPWRAPEDYPSIDYGTMRDLFPDWGSLVTESRAFWPVVQAVVRRRHHRHQQRHRRPHARRLLRPLGARVRRRRRRLARRVWEHQDRIERELSAVGRPRRRARPLEHPRHGRRRAPRLGSHYMVRYVKRLRGRRPVPPGLPQRPEAEHQRHLRAGGDRARRRRALVRARRARPLRAAAARPASPAASAIR